MFCLYWNKLCRLHIDLVFILSDVISILVTFGGVTHIKYFCQYFPNISHIPAAISLVISRQSLTRWCVHGFRTGGIIEYSHSVAISLLSCYTAADISRLLPLHWERLNLSSSPPGKIRSIDLTDFHQIRPWLVIFLKEDWSDNRSDTGSIGKFWTLQDFCR